MRLFLAALILSISTIQFSVAEDVENDIGRVDRNFPDLDLDILGSSYFDDGVEDEMNKKPVEEPVVVVSKAPCLGCPEAIDNVEDDKLNEIARLAFGDFMAMEDEVGSDDDLVKTFVRVLKAERQVVAGVKYMLEVELGWSNCTRSQHRDNADSCLLDVSRPRITCDFHVLEKPWLNVREVIHTQCLNDVDSVSSPPMSDDDTTVEAVVPQPESEVSEGSQGREKRETKYGETKETAEDKETLMGIAKFAVEQLDEVDEDNFARFAVDVLSSNKQTVSGWLYHLKIRVAQTSCLEHGDATLATCQHKISLPFQRCEVKVLFQPWQKVQKKLVHSQCVKEDFKSSKKIAKQLFGDFDKQSQRSGRLIGGPNVIDPESDDIAELVNFAIDSVDRMSNALHVQKLVRVVYAERKLVSGVATKLSLELGYTNCRKSPNVDKTACDIDLDREHTYCNVTIVEKSWRNERKVVSSKCGNREEVMRTSRTKRNASLDTLEVDLDKLEFERFLEEHDKQYSPEEFSMRLKIFKDNMEKVKLLQETEQGTAIYGPTKFSDLTEEEFSAQYLGLRIDLKQRMKRKRAKTPQLRSLPENFDWRNFSAVTPVKNQGGCGSCWAFSVTGNMEGLYAIKHGKLLSFSEQELVDCDKLDEGCKGGLPENAYKALEKIGGLETESDYPYDGHDEKCHFNRSRVATQVTGFVEISKNETEMAAWLLKNGPISIGINANAMQFYFGGVSHPWKFLCSPKTLDHGVLIVGYGVHATSRKSTPYWTVKNSWGTNWGEKGYYRVFRGGGTCGLNQMATSATAA